MVGVPSMAFTQRLCKRFLPHRFVHFRQWQATSKLSEMAPSRPGLDMQDGGKYYPNLSATD